MNRDWDLLLYLACVALLAAMLLLIGSGWWA